MKIKKHDSSITSGDHVVTKLLEEYQKITHRLNEVNSSINEVEADGEDVLPGHDEGSEYWSRMVKYKVLLENAELIKKQLRKLGYKKI